MYTVTPSDHYLAGVITKFSEYIQTSSKTPLQLLTSPVKDCLKKENYELKGAKLELNVTGSVAPSKPASKSSSGPGSNPASGWVNLVLLGSPPPAYVGSNQAGVILPGDSIDETSLNEIAQDVFGLYNVKLELYSDAAKKSKVDKVKSGSTVFVTRWNEQDSSSCSSSNGFNCNFVNVDIAGKVSSVLLENPRGKPVSDLTEAFKNLAKGKKVKLFSDNQKKKEVSVNTLSNLVGQTLYL